MTTGFSKYSDRQMAVWSQKDFTQPLKTEAIDSSSGVLVPLFGLRNILAAFKPDAEESKIRIAIEVYSALSISFQV